MKRTALVSSLAFSLVFTLTGTTLAATQGPAPEDKVPYVVRYLVFQHQGYWDDPLDSAGPERSEPQVTGAGPGNTQAQDVQNGASGMDRLWTKLSDSSRYRPLLQGLAVPFAVPEDQAAAIPLGGSWPASIRPPFNAMGDLADRPMRLLMGAGWAPPEMDGPWGRDRVQGAVTFHKGRYAHLAVDLVFTEATRWMPWGLDVRRYHLTQSRRLLPNRYYYFDHPRFGLIARIEPMNE